MNNKTHAFLASLCLSALLSCTAPPASADDLPAALPLWATGAPGSQGHDGPEVSTIEGTGPTSFVSLTHVNNPSITPFLPPAGKATGAALVIAPGGGHKLLAIDHEGYQVAKVLSQQGIACFVLKYRLAKEPNSPYTVEVHELMDMQRAIRTVRSRAGQWAIDPHRIGVIGFSAGGELVVLATTRYDKPVVGSNDDVDKMDCRPDFQALLYPGGLTNIKTIPLNKQTPPAFLACDYDDRPTISRNLAEYYLALKDAGVPAELHIYNSGGHGFGVRPTNAKPNATWTNRLVDWMRDRGLLTAQTP